MKNDYESLLHTKWRCQYHTVITSKYRRQIVYGNYHWADLQNCIKSCRTAFRHPTALSYVFMRITAPAHA